MFSKEEVKQLHDVIEYAIEQHSTSDIQVLNKCPSALQGDSLFKLKKAIETFNHDMQEADLNRVLTKWHSALIMLNKLNSIKELEYVDSILRLKQVDNYLLPYVMTRLILARMNCTDTYAISLLEDMYIEVSDLCAMIMDGE
jgi:hypothetical protein